MGIKVKPLKLAKYQREFLYSDARFTVVEASTKSGKTVSHIFWLFEYSHGGNPKHVPKRGNEYWWVAPISSQATIAYNRLKRKVQHTGLYKCYDTSGKERIESPNGTIIRFKSADKPDSLFGEDVHAVVFDEFTRAKSNAWTAIRSTLTKTGGPCKFIGNYTGESNWGHILGLKAKRDPAYQYFKVTAAQAVKAGILEKSEIDQARRDLPKGVFEALYFAKGSAGDDILFTPETVLDIWTNDFVIKEQELAEKETGVPSKNYITADIALHGSDRFVLGAWHGMALVEIIAVDKIGAQDVEQMIRDLAKKHTVPQSRIVYDADGIGAYLEGYIGGAIPFHNGGAPIKDSMSERVNFKHLKAQCFFKLAQIIDKMFVADDTYQEQIVEELTAIKKKLSGDQKMSVTSKDEVKEMIGRSPDFADMIMMRTRFELDTFTGEYEFA